MPKAYFPIFLAPIPQYNMPLDFQQILQSLQKGKKKQSEQQS